MSGLQSNSDALLVAVPMVLILFAGFFRLDELWITPRKRKLQQGRRLTDWDENGVPICTDPEGAALTIARRKY
jgi:hypothetical protein